MKPLGEYGVIPKEDGGVFLVRDNPKTGMSEIVCECANAAELQAAIEEIKSGGGKSFNTTAEFFDDLGIEKHYE